MNKLEKWKDSEEQAEQKNQDRFTSLMFGSRNEINQDEHLLRQEPAHNQSTIDYAELMMNIDTLMESVRGFKPLFNKVYPLIGQFLKKK